MRAILPAMSLIEAIDPSLKAPPAGASTEVPAADAFLQMVAALAAPVEPFRAAQLEAQAGPSAGPPAATPDAPAGLAAPASQLAPSVADDGDSEADSSAESLGAGLVAWLAGPLPPPAPGPAMRADAQPAAAGAPLQRPVAETWVRLNAAAPVVATPEAPQPEAVTMSAAIAPAARANAVAKPSAAERPTADASVAEAPISRAEAPVSRAQTGAAQAPLPLLAVQAAPAEAASFHAPVEPGSEAAEAARPEPLLEIDDSGVWIDRLARDLASLADGRSSLRFRLHPESLGSLAVEVSQSESGVAVRLTADSESARAILADAHPRLVLEARAQGVRLAETHIDMAGEPGSGSAGTGHQSHHGEDRGHRARAPEPAWAASSETNHGHAPEPMNPAARGSERYA